MVYSYKIILSFSSFFVHFVVLRALWEMLVFRILFPLFSCGGSTILFYPAGIQEDIPRKIHFLYVQIRKYVLK